MWDDMVRGLRRLTAASAAMAGAVAVTCALAPCGSSRADEDRPRLERLLEAADDGDWAWAAKLARDTGVPALQTYLRWRQLMEASDPPAFETFAAFLRAGTDWPNLGTLQVRAEEAMSSGVPVEERLAFFARRSPRTRQGRILYADALLAAGRAGEAAPVLREAWVRDDFGPDEEGLFLDRFGAALTAEAHSARLDRLLWDRRTDQARRMLPRVRPGERAQAAARLKLQLSDPGVEAALAALPAAARADAGVMFDRLRWRKEHGSEAGVQEILLSPPEQLRRPELWWREQDKAIRDALAERGFKLAYRLASNSRQTAGVPHAEAEWLAGWLGLQFTGQPKAARRHFERLWPAVSTPISRGRAGYWAGRAATATGDGAAAQGWYERAAGYPSSFYGQLAAAELGHDPGRRLPASRMPTETARTALERRLPAQLAHLFCRQGEAAYAQPFFRHLGFEAADDADQLAAVMALAEGCGRADLVLAAARGAAGNGAYLLRESYPLPRGDAFRQGRDGMAEPALVLAVARQESLFDPAARSRAGALGLMQLMPGTAEAMSRELREEFTTGRLTRDPDFNVRLGAFYLARQLARFDNEPALALAAYNAGPGRVTEWLERNGDPRGGDRYRLIDWIELIPFAETRNYVQRVLEGRGMYRVALGQPALPPARAVGREAPLLPRAKPAS
ncbi:MAG: lytic transglycosylase domain-containing protein [Geminicoccaceae bacterium]